MLHSTGLQRLMKNLVSEQQQIYCVLIGNIINTNILIFSSVSQSCLTLYDPMDCSMPGLPVHHQLLELAQNHVHQVGNAVQPSHPLSSPSPPAFNHSSIKVFQMSQFFPSGGQRIGVSASASFLPMNIQD